LDRSPLSPPTIHVPRAAVPVLLSVPHSGREYPQWLLANAAGGRAAMESLEDPLVDRLVWRALARGIGAVIARTPRAAIDCNRSADEIDPSVIADAGSDAIGIRARGGLGIVPSRSVPHGRLWRRPIDQAELGRRVAEAHAPFHEAVAGEPGQRLVEGGVGGVELGMAGALPAVLGQRLLLRAKAAQHGGIDGQNTRIV